MLGLALLGGIALGVVDFVWIKYVPFPLADLGNSSAMWAVAAFAFGYLTANVVRAAAGAAVLLVAAVPSYYVAAALIQGDDLAAAWTPAALLWMCFGVLAGVIFGVGGAWARAAGGWRRTVGVALPVAVLLAEAALQARRIGTPSYGDDPIWPAVIRVVLAVLLALLAVRPLRQRASVLGAAVPLAALGFAAFTLAGFG